MAPVGYLFDNPGYLGNRVGGSKADFLGTNNFLGTKAE